MKKFWILVAILAVIGIYYFWSDVRDESVIFGKTAADLAREPADATEADPHQPVHYRSVPLHITFVPGAANHDQWGHISTSPWGGGDYSIPREYPTVSGTIGTKGADVHMAALPMMECRDLVHGCSWDVIMEYAVGRSDHFDLTLTERLRRGAILAYFLGNTRSIENQDGVTHTDGAVRRLLVDDGLDAGSPWSVYHDIHVRSGLVTITQTGPANEPEPVAVASTH
jgi:hypothetical protein